MKEYYMPEILMPWSALKQDFFGELKPIETHEGMGNVGWIPVFTSKELCKKHCEVLTITKP